MGKTKRHGLVLVNTGNGKGKTSASLGVAFRALGWDWKVLIVQFFKGKWTPGEERVINKYNLPIDYKPFGSGFTWDENNTDKIKQECSKAWQFAKEHILKADYDLIIIDEINIAMYYNTIDVDDVLYTLKRREKWLHIILTGRNVPEKIKEYADLVSEINAVKHPFEQGISAQKGIEF
ncbi:MAG: cob(I)yrinic acid a,c-diamide adenosyltransferase [Victivallales bacterium]|nr:cob(I)yrinic acid a,c-diamide adenosyltransferase [Victivallales bacterium]